MTGPIANAPTYSKSKTLVLGLGFLGISLVWAIYQAYVPVFLKEHFNLSASWVGWVSSGNNLATLLLLPYFGSLSDRTSTRFGRRLPFLAIGAPLGAIFFIWIPMAAVGTSLAMFLVALAGWNIAMSIYRSPTVALMPDLTPSKYRSQANGIINLMGGFGAVIAYLGGKALYDHDPAFPFWVGAVLSILASVAVLVWVREPKHAVVDAGASDASAKVGVVQSLKVAMQAGDRSLFWLLTGMFLWSVGFAAIAIFFTSYAKFHLGLAESSGAVILGIFALAFLAAALPAGTLAARIGRNRSIRIGLLVITVVMLATLGLHSMVAVSAVFVIGGVAWAMVNVNSLPMVIDMAPPNAEGGYTGIYYLFGQGSTLIAPPIAGIMIDGMGYPALMGFSAACFLLGLGCMFGVKSGEARSVSAAEGVSA